MAKQASLLEDDLLDPVDRLLDDPELVELVPQLLIVPLSALLKTGDGESQREGAFPRIGR